MKTTAFKTIAVIATSILIFIGAVGCEKESSTDLTVNTFTVRVGWGNNPSTNQCFSLVSGTTYSLAAGASNSASVDLIGYQFHNSGPCWFAPSSCDATAGWSRRKGTKVGFSNVIECTPAVFSGISTVSQLLTYTDYIDDVVGRTQDVKEGFVYPVKTYEGKKGLIHVVRIAGNDDDVASFMDLEIKMER